MLVLLCRLLCGPDAYFFAALVVDADFAKHVLATVAAVVSDGCW